MVFIGRVIPPYYGGAGRATFQMAKDLQNKGLEVVMLTNRFDRNIAAYEVMEGVAVYRFMAPPIYRLAQMVFSIQCAVWLLTHPTSCDVVQFSIMPRHWLPVRLVARLLRLRVFMRITLFKSSDRVSKRPLLRRFLPKPRYDKVDGILAMTRKLMDVSTTYHCDPSTIHYIPKPVDLTVFHPLANNKAKATLREKLGIGARGGIAVFIGSVIERKGIDLLVEAWPTVRRTLPQARLYIIGPRSFDREKVFNNRDFSAQIDRRIDELGISDSIIFLGHKKQGLPDYLRMADLFVLPSRQEGLASALLEAMASGLPCLVCKQPWLPDDLVRHGETGLVCESTPESIAEGILKILTTQKLAEEMGIAARKVAEEEYNPTTLTDKIIELYASSL